MMLLDLVGVVLDQVRRLLDVANTLQSVLPGFESHERRPFGSMLADLIRHGFEEPDTLGPRSRAPRRKRGPRCSNRIRHLSAAGALKAPEKNARVDRAAVVEFRRGPNLPTSDDQRIASAEGGPDP